MNVTRGFVGDLQNQI